MKINISLSADAVKPNKWYIVESVVKGKDRIYAGPFDSEKAADAEHVKRGLSDKKNGLVTHYVMSGQDCKNEGIKQ